MDRLAEVALDQPGSASIATLRRAWYFVSAVILVAIAVVVFGGTRLPAYPQFATFHAGFVLVADAVTALLLFGQFTYRRLPFYLLLAAAYLFNALIVVVFLLTFPGALKDEGGVLGGTQSAVWIWHFWHILFPILVSIALFAHIRQKERQVARPVVGLVMLQTVTVVALLVLLLGFAVTAFHDRMPTLLMPGPNPLTGAFYVVGGVAAIASTAALVLALYQAREARALHVWLVVTMVALLADVAASLAADARYTVGWYFGRVESMFAASVLLVVLVKEINRLYARLAVTLNELVFANRELSTLVAEKEDLVENLRVSEEQIRRLAYYDPVTELPNRWLVMERLRHALVQGERYRRTTALLYLDLDNFKQINDTLGHEVGDCLLRAFAHHLTHCIRAGDTVSRLGGDEFVVLLPEISQQQDAVAIAEKIIAVLQEPMEVGGQGLFTTASIGIAVNRAEDDFDANELLRRADTAMYAAKRAGRNRYCLSPESAP